MKLYEEDSSMENIYMDWQRFSKHSDFYLGTMIGASSTRTDGSKYFGLIFVQPTKPLKLVQIICFDYMPSIRRSIGYPHSHYAAA